MRQPKIGVEVGYPAYTDAPDDFFVLMGFVLMGFVLMSQGIGTDDLRMMAHFKEALARLKDDGFGPTPVAADETPWYLDNVHLFPPSTARPALQPVYIKVIHIVQNKPDDRHVRFLQPFNGSFEPRA